MLSCRELHQQQASNYLDGYLPWRKRLAVGTHLALCSACRRFLRQLRLVKAVLREQPDAALADSEARPLAARLYTVFRHQQKNTSDLL
jgi:anti-sigma factor RsiW